MQITIDTRPQLYIHQQTPADLQSRYNLSILTVNGTVRREIRTTQDFSFEDPWSVHMRDIIEKKSLAGMFQGKKFRELGIGDGRNPLIAEGITSVEGIDIDRNRLPIASENLQPLEKQGIPVTLYQGDAIRWIQQSEETWSDWVIACLPQAPLVKPENLETGIESITDVYNPHDEVLQKYGKWNMYGLSLNAAALDALAQKANADLHALLILSGRIPPSLHEQLFYETGWKVVESHHTEIPIQQDPDTNVSYIHENHLDDGRRFFEEKNGVFLPISAQEAELRRQTSIESGQGRKELNAYHHLVIYDLTSNVDKRIKLNGSRRSSSFN